jgi:signal transduction histidine kinase
MPPLTSNRTDSKSNLREQIAYFASHLPIKSLLDTVSDIFLIVNEDQRVVFASQRVAEVFDLGTAGLKPGMLLSAALRCARSSSGSGSTGDSSQCQVCGVFSAVAAAQDGKTGIQECRITTQQGKIFDFHVVAQPLVTAGWHFTMILLQDVTQEKHRALEHIFFHDLLNIAGTMATLSGLLKETQTEEDDELKILIHDLSLRLVEEIHSHRDLLNAENGDLYIHVQPTLTRDILDELKHYYESSALMMGRQVQIDPAAAHEVIQTDPALLRRVLGNMVKNALEASSKTEVVTVNCRRAGNAVEFTVHNPNPIPDEVQPHVFQRSFSTKGEGRGLGTYSMKLLTERYLHGEVSFSSTPADGTSFMARFPLEFPE